jgi:hypothetical protein
MTEPVVGVARGADLVHDFTRQERIGLIGKITSGCTGLGPTDVVPNRGQV